MAKGIKTGGRELGTPNKSTDELRQTVQSFIENNLDSMQANFDLLEPKEKLLFIEKMLNFSLPRLQATQLTAQVTPIVELTHEERKAEIARIKQMLSEI